MTFTSNKYSTYKLLSSPTILEFLRYSSYMAFIVNVISDILVSSKCFLHYEFKN